MKSASKLFLCVACVALAASTVTAQSVLTEDFSTASGATPPMGWSSIVNIATNGQERWRFDDPGARGTPTAMTAPVAVYDDDALSASGGMSDVELISPPFDASMASSLLLTFENKFIELATSTILVEAFDGFNWNVAYTHTTPDIPVGAAIGDAQSELTIVDITAAAGGNPAAMVRFHWTLGSWDWYWQVDNVDIFEPMATTDVGVSAILNPNSGTGALLCGPYSANETVTVSVQNFALTTLPAGSMVPVQHDVDGMNIVNETMTTTVALAFGQSENYTFTAGADLTTGPGPFTVNATTALLGDADFTNDASSSVIPPAGGGASLSLPFNEDFGNTVDLTGTFAPAGWVNDMTENANDNASDNWFFDNNGTSSGVGPTEDATTGVPGMGAYAFIEDSATTSDEVAISLVTPCLDLTGATAPVLNFEVWSFDSNPAGPGTNDLDIDVISYPGSVVVPDLLTVPDLGVGVWTTQSLDLSAFAGSEIRIVFRGRNDNGSFYHDLSIDDVTVFEPIINVGQPSQPGFATLDVNGAARNGANAPVSSGQNGAYSVALSMSGGDSLGLQIGMEPVAGLPTLLLIGRTLEGAVPIAPFGTVDLDPASMTLPIAIIGNGFAAPPTFFDTLFFSNAAGEINLTFPLTSALMGLSPFGLSAINLSPTFGIAITNTTDVTINM